MIINTWIRTFNLFEALKENPTIITFSIGVIKIIDIMLKKTFYMIEKPLPNMAVIDSKIHYFRKNITYLDGRG